MKRLYFIALALSIFSIKTFGQLETFLGDMNPERNYYDIRNSMVAYLDSLRNTMDSATFYAGGGEFKRFKKFAEIWEPRVNPHGFFSPFIDAQYNFYTNLKDSYLYYIDEPWQELGPQRSLERNYRKGIGPVEFVTFYDNGTDDSTHFMLTGSTCGGLFYSSDTANTWHSAGSDDWPASGCVSAIFHPLNHEIWFAASSGEESTSSAFIKKTGGIWRTTNAGQEWELIADFTDFNNNTWNKIFKIAINPQLPQVLFAATSKGLFKTDTCLTENPDWEKVLDGKIYDLEFKPNSDSLVYASVYDIYNSVWKLVHSEHYGNAGTWNEMEQLPDTLTNINISKHNITIEVSKAKPDYLYAATRKYLDTNYINYYYKNLDSSANWNHIWGMTSTWRYNHGTGHAFGVEQVQHGEEIMFSDYIEAGQCDFDGVFEYINNIVHDDVEDVVYHPYHPNEVWICTHGGVEVSYDNGNSWEHRYNGLGVAQVEKMATSYTNPELILTGLYHDGTKLTTADYEPEWDPDWKYCYWYDGQKPLIDNINPLNMWASGQKGKWAYTADTFNTVQNIHTQAHFISEGALNKKNPNVLYRNAKSNEIPFQEDILRSPNRGLSNDTISTFKNFFPQNNTILITGIFTPYSNGDFLAVILIERDSTDRYHLFFTKNANANPGEVAWHKITTPRSIETTISALGFDPYDPDILYMSYSRPAVNSGNIDSLIYRIDCSDFSNVQSEDITFNLPETVVLSRCIALNKQSNGGVFLATEFGVYYTDNDQMLNTGNEWLKVGTNLPNVRPRGIEINYPGNTLRVGLFGRGIWELPLPDACQLNSQALNIYNDTTWNSFVFLDRNLIVNSGATLTIGSDALVGSITEAKIIVKPGGKLILNGGTLTNACGDLWGGIEVWGNPENIQVPADQGWLSISNGGTVENAVTGVRVGSEDFAGKGGGIVHTDSAFFRNNQTGVLYHNYAGSNIGNFNLTTFETTAELVDSSTPQDLMKLISVENIKINGCTFRNTRDSDVAYSSRGKGITAIEASFYVDHQCISETTPCSAYQETVFDSLYYGVYAYNISSALAPSIKNSQFTKNYRGAYLSGITWAVVDSCSFETNADFNPTGGYGLYLDNCTGYTIEENNFYSTMQSPTSIGMIVHNSGTDPNEIYRNWFNNLEQGISAQEQNRDPRSILGQGLQIRCCTFDTCNFDILVPPPALAGRGIAMHQGANSDSAIDMAGNLFDIHSQTPNNDYDDLNNQGSYFSYYYPTNSNDYRVKPVDYTRNTVNRVGKYISTPLWVFDSACPPSAINGSTSEIELMMRLSKTNQQIINTEQTLEALVDGGDTDALYQDIEDSYPPEAMEVYNDLMGASPYLSDTVVGATIKKEEVIPGAMLRDIMVANPQSAKSEKLMAKLDDRYTPLPEYMKAQILQGRNLLGLKESLESQLAKYRLQKQRAFNKLIHHYMHHDVISGWRDSISNLLATVDELPAKYQLSLWQLQNGEPELSGNTLDNIPTTFDLKGDELSAHNDMVTLHSILSGIMSTDSGWPLVSPAQIQQLGNLSNATSPASVYARNILIASGNQAYVEPIQMPDLMKASVAEEVFQKILNTQKPAVLELYPNPANDYFVLSYQLENKTIDATVEVRNTKGELIKTITVSQPKNQHVVNTETWKPGVYIATFMQDGEPIDSIKITLTK